MATGLTRRAALAAGAAMYGAGMLAACATPGSQQPAAQNAQPVTLQWMTDWTGGARLEASKQTLPVFEAENPKIKLEMQSVNDGTYEVFAANMAAGTLPDVMLFSGNLFEYYAEKGAFYDIGPALKKAKFDKESVYYEPQYFEYKGKQHGLPYQFTISSWVYNKTWFRQSGVTPPTDAWTTDDLVAAGQKLNMPEQNKWAIQMQHVPAYAWVWVYANGSDLTTYADPIRSAVSAPKTLEAFQYAIELIQRHRVAPIVGGPNAVAGIPGFQAGGYAMTVNNSAKSLGTTIKDQFEWDIMPTPRWAGTKKRVTNWNHQGHIVMKQAEVRGHADAAAQFAMWMTADSASTIVAKTGGATPVNKKIATSTVYLDGSPPSLKLQLDMLAKKPDQDARGFRIFKFFTPWNNAITPVLGEGFFGQIGVKEMGTKADQVGNAAIDSGRL